MPVDAPFAFDRRSFLISPLAAVVATTDFASGRNGRTVYTGDVIHGKKVVSALDISDLEPGRKHFCIFRVSSRQPDIIGMSP